MTSHTLSLSNVLTASLLPRAAVKVSQGFNNLVGIWIAKDAFEAKFLNTLDNGGFATHRTTEADVPMCARETTYMSAATLHTLLFFDICS